MERVTFLLGSFLQKNINNSEVSLYKLSIFFEVQSSKAVQRSFLFFFCFCFTWFLMVMLNVYDSPSVLFFWVFVSTALTFILVIGASLFLTEIKHKITTFSPKRLNKISTKLILLHKNPVEVHFLVNNNCESSTKIQLKLNQGPMDIRSYKYMELQ